MGVMSGYEIPEGALIMTDNHCIQNDPALVDRVDEFLPERWSEDSVQARKGTEKAVCDHAMLRDSFGMGARSCLGQRVAKLEIQVAVARMVRDWNLELQPGQSWQTKSAPFAKAEPFPCFCRGMIRWEESESVGTRPAERSALDQIQC